MNFKRIGLISAIVLFLSNSAYQTVQLHEIRKEIEFTSSQVDDLDTKLSSVEGDVENVSGDVDDIETKVKDIESKVDGIEDWTILHQ